MKVRMRARALTLASAAHKPVAFVVLPQTAVCFCSHVGWLHSGDVGMWLPGTRASPVLINTTNLFSALSSFCVDGTLKIIDRKKNIFKLAQGEVCASRFMTSCAMPNP